MQPPVRFAATEPGFLFRSLQRRRNEIAGLFVPVVPETALAGPAPAVLMINGQHLDRAEGQLDALLARAEIRAALQTHLVLAIDACGEGYAVPPEVFAAWHGVLDRHAVPAGRLAYVTHNECTPAAYRDWQRAAGRPDALRVLLHHPFLDHQADWMRRALSNPAERMVRLQTALGGPAAVQHRARVLCLNNKAHAHRMVVVGRLARRGLLAECLVSFAHATRAVREADVAPALARARDLLPRFAADLDAFEGLMPHLPLVIAGDPAVRISEVVHDVPLRLYGRALFSIVGETNFTEQGMSRFTEKSVKALAGGHPTIIAGLPGTLRLLREHGFATFAPYLDEAYDDIAAPDDRLDALLAEAERILRLSNAGAAALLRRCLPCVEHNLRHFTEGLPALLQRRLAELARSFAWMAEPDPA